MLGAAVVLSRAVVLKSVPVWQTMPYEDSHQVKLCYIQGTTRVLLGYC